MRYNNQEGAAPLPLLLGIVGVVAFLAITSAAPFRDSILTSIFPKQESQAAAGDLNGSTFFETFTANPANPLPFTSSRWDIQVHERGMFKRSPGAQHPMNAQHGMDCGAPPSTHSVSDSANSVFNCRDHVMTSLNGEEYGVIYLTPNHMMDWSQGNAVLSFDLSTEQMSRRDWPDILLTPWADQQALPLLSPLSEGVDLQGPSKNTISISFATGEGAPILTIVRNNVRQEFQNGTPLSSGITAGTNQSATRQPLKLTVSNNRIRFERLASPTATAIVWFDQAISPLGFNQAIVQLGHHSYTPFKDNSGVAATWHWDNVSISPAIPFSIQSVSPRFIGDSGTVTFPPAPANAILRFSAIGRPIVNGVSRNPVTFQGQPEHWSSYNVPIPQGSTSATIVMAKHDWYEHGYMAKDFAVWSTTAPITTPTPSPSSSPSVQPSPIPSPSPSAAPSIAPSTAPSIAPSPSPRKPGDVDGDDFINIFDYNEVLTNFGKTTGFNILTDFDNNGAIDIFDYNEVLTNFGK